MRGDKLLPEEEAECESADAQHAAEKEAAYGAEEIFPEQAERRQQRVAYPALAVHGIAHDVDLDQIPPETRYQGDEQNQGPADGGVKKHRTLDINCADPIQQQDASEKQNPKDDGGHATGQNRGAHKAPEIRDSAAQQHRKPRRLGRDVDKGRAREKNEEHKELQQVQPDSGMDCD